MSVIYANVDLSQLGIFNVKYYGAIGDGSADDSPAIQSAINAAHAVGGGVVYLPSARYLLNGGPLTIPIGNRPGEVEGVVCQGLAPAPSDFVWADPAQNSYFPPNIPASIASGGTLPDGMLPNGPLILFDNIVLLGDGPEQTFLVAGEQFYNGWHFSPTGGSAAQIQLGVLIANTNYWANYASDLENFPGGYFANKVYIRNLSIDAQGSMGKNAGKPIQVLAGGITAIPNPSIFPSQTAEDGNPIGQLYGACITLQDVLDCGVENVWIYDGNVNGIAVIGTLNAYAFADGPLPQSYQQTDGSGNYEFFPNTLFGPGPPVNPTHIKYQHNVPTLRGFVRHCQIDLNYPMWLAGSKGTPAGGGYPGQLPIRAVGASDVTLEFNRIGQRNQPSSFPAPPPETTNPPAVSPNTNDGMDCPGAWNSVITGNVITNCGDGIGSDGNGNLVISNNVIYNIGSVAIESANGSPPAASNKCASQTVIIGNTIFLANDEGSSPPIAIAILDVIPAPNPDTIYDAVSSTHGSVVVSNNVIYGCAYNVMVDVQVLGAIVIGNIFDYAGVQPQNQPVSGGALNYPSSPVWPAPNGAGVKVEGNDIIVEGNIFRNAGAAGTPNSNAVGVLFPNDFPPSGIGDSTRVLVKGNIFDATIGSPIQDSTGVPGALKGVRIIDNIGANPPPPSAISIGLAPFPGISGMTFSNPYPYDCLVNVVIGATLAVSNVSINGFVTNVKVPSNDQKSFIVKAGGSIALTYAGLPTGGSWTWVGL